MRTSCHNQRLRGFTLVEVIISMSIFVSVVVMLFEVFNSLRSYTNMENSRSTLGVEAHRVMSILRKDLGNSAWFLPEFDDPKGPLAYDSSGLEYNSNDEAKRDLNDTTADRDLRYYPYAIIQNNNGQGSRFAAFSNNSPPVIDENPYRGAEHYLPSQELIFVKVAAGAHVDTPSQITTSNVSFEEADITPFSDYKEAKIIPHVSLQVADGNIEDAALNFEHDTNGALREYGYRLVDPGQGGRRLERVYYHRADDDVNGSTESWELDQIISYNVDRIILDTYRTKQGLGVDQIHITIFFSMDDEQQRTTTFRTQGTVALRSTVDPEYSENIDEWLGNGGSFQVEYE